MLSDEASIKRTAQQLACLLILVGIALPLAPDFVSCIFLWIAAFQSVLNGREPYCFWW